jgi:1-deoxy-D-xylulose-5-phosphate reductoisomerase
MIILGSTGSIGVNALYIAKKYNLEVETLVAGKNIELLNSQIKQFNPKRVVVASKDDIKRVKHNNVTYSHESILEAIDKSSSDLVVNALVGFMGLKPTIESIKMGKKIALANKESLVVAGDFVDTSCITPIDSEHFGLWYLQNQNKVAKMTITASGGAFRDTPIYQIPSKKLQDALKHPNWSMGTKITIDSATMVNKLFELLEAYWLFRCKELDAVIETKSLIHAFVDFVDGSTTAHIANADMKLPIAYAILGKVEDRILENVDFTKIKSLEFRDIDVNRYPIWQIKDQILSNPNLGVVINAANEIAIDSFKKEKISFGGISDHIIKTLKRYQDQKISSLDDIFEVDQEIRKLKVIVS